jgi:UDP-glucuronate decarboxylase
LGSHLSRALLTKNHEVLCLDNFITSSKSSIEDLLDNKKFELIRHDVTIPINVEVDAIFNLACPASPVHYQKDPVQTTKTNVIGATNVLDLATKLNVAVLQASTSEIYGDPEISPQGEEYWGNVNPIGMRSCYDEGKRVAETLFFDYHRQYGTKIKVIRIFNTYGPAMQFNDGRVVSNFILQALENKPITIYGEGSQTRSFCYVSDLIEGMLKYMFATVDVPGPINLGNPNEVSIGQLAQVIIKLTNSNSQIEYRELPHDDPKQRRPLINKASEILGWNPTIDLEEGLKKTIADFKSRLTF